MAGLILKAKKIAAEGVVPEQRLPDLARWLTAVSDGGALELSPLLLLALAIRGWYQGRGVALLAVAFSIFYWGSARHPWRHRTALALAAGLLAIFFIAPVRAQSQPPQYVATVWQTEQGMPSNLVYDMVQDHEGYLWLATGDGIVRFDGARFKILGAADIPSLRSGRITSLHESRSGDLWIGTQNSGLIRLRDGVAVTYTNQEGLPSTFVNSIREDAEGNLWINTSRGIARFTGGKLEPYPTHHGKAVREFFLQSRDGSMWFRSGMDVVRFGPDGSVATPGGGFMVREARDGSVWIAYHDFYRVVRYHQGVFSDVPLPRVGRRQWTGAYPEQGVLAMATDTDGEVVLLTPAGLVRAVDGRLSPPEVLPIPANIGDLPKVFSLVVDREGNRWVGTLATGLLRFRRAPVTAYGKDEGLSDLPFRAVFQDREGRIWLGGDSLYWFDGRQFHLFPGLADIHAIAQTNDGDLWFGGTGGLYRWRSGVLTRFRVEAPSVEEIRQDRQGTLWIIEQTYVRQGGLYRFREGQFERVVPGGYHTVEDQDGGLWVATGIPGLRYLHGGKTVLYDEGQGLPRRIVTQIYVDCLHLGGVKPSPSGDGFS